MAMKTNKGKDALFTEINITPLTDIFLVLLIIMMVVAPTFQSVDNNLEMPEINSGVSIEQKNCVVSITKDGLMYVNGKEISQEALAEELVTIKPTLEKKEVVVKADAKAKNSIVLKVMDAAQEAKYQKLIVAGEPLTKKEQNELKSNKQSTKKQELPVLKDTTKQQTAIPVEDEEWVD
jgi:biopolymer transport protein ExbD/biopolymer transport protein TolR